MSQYQTRLDEKSFLKQVPTWPANSIVLLLIFTVIFPPGFLTGMNTYLLLLSLIVWIGGRKKFPQNLFSAIFPFGLIILIGLASGAGAERYLYLKDVWYVANPAIIMSVGYVFYLCMPDIMRGMRAFVIGGTLLSLYYLSSFAFHPELLISTSTKIRQNAGTGYYASVLAFSILCTYYGRWNKELNLPRWLAYLSFIICSTAIIACFSRTMLVIAVIGLLAATGIFGRKDWLWIGALIGLALLLILSLNLLISKDSTQSERTFIGKLVRSLDEINIEDYSDFRSINLNWRGYETARAIHYVESGSPYRWIVGQGFGAQVDLGINMKLGGAEPTRFIPVFHNGYIYLLVKGGIIAVFLYSYVLVWFYLIGRRVVIKVTDRIQSAPARLLQACTFTLAITTWLISGSFNKGDMFPYLLASGFLLAAISNNKEKFK
ncbi:MAG TPA: O-antigen ligase family protein [Methylotenera sp.]|nr:O-antigen ligase family protein [Methylotenera sp.]HPH06645.1 O-antigen ligase family protein [Methylotenera sp.]HPM49016.1 O-antigen ligase family protein [Methylotenera sp.]